MNYAARYLNTGPFLLRQSYAEIILPYLGGCHKGNKIVQGRSRQLEAGYHYTPIINDGCKPVYLVLLDEGDCKPQPAAVYRNLYIRL